MKTHPNFLLLFGILPAFVWSAIEPFDRLTWWLEVAPVLIALPLLVAVRAYAEDYPRLADRLRPADFARDGLQAESLLVIHYHRPAKDYDNWNLWCWPEGGEDVGLAVDWLSAHAADFGGDPARIVVIGTSAGAVHIATALKLRPDLPVAGAVLLSGLYGHTPLDDRDEPYYGPNADYAGRMPRETVAATTIPLFIACAQFDPPRFQAEFLGLMQDRLERHGTMPQATILPGHNHYSMAMHIGTSDRRLTDEIVAFVNSATT